MAVAAYLKPTAAARYSTTINFLRNGVFVEPTHVDYQPEKACNLRCVGCIGSLANGTVPLDDKISPYNIGKVLDQTLEGFTQLPFIHFSGLTGDPFVGVRRHGGTLTDLSCITTEGIVHLIKKGWNYAEKAVVITNGVGLARRGDELRKDSSDPFNVRLKELGLNEWGYAPLGERAYTFTELLAYIGFVMVSLDASNAAQYKRGKGVDLFEHVMDNLQMLNFWKHAYGVDRSQFFDHLGLAEDIPKSSPMSLNVNYVLTDDNCDISDGFIERLLSNEVGGLRFRVDLFRGQDADFQKRMFEMVSGLAEKYRDSGLKIVMKSPDKPINKDSFPVCFAPLFWPAIGRDGLVYPCAHSVMAGQQIGSLWERSLLDILRDYHEKLIAGDIGSPNCSFLCPSTAGNINLLSTAG